MADIYSTQVQFLAQAITATLMTVFIALVASKSSESWLMQVLFYAGVGNCLLMWSVCVRGWCITDEAAQPEAEAPAAQPSAGAAAAVTVAVAKARQEQRRQDNRKAALAARGKYGRRAFGSSDLIPRDDEACAIARDPALNDVDACSPRAWPPGYPEAVARMDAVLASTRLVASDSPVAGIDTWMRDEDTAQHEAGPPAGGSGGSLEAGAENDGGCDD